MMRIHYLSGVSKPNQNFGSVGGTFGSIVISKSRFRDFKASSRRTI